MSGPARRPALMTQRDVDRRAWISASVVNALILVTNYSPTRVFALAVAVQVGISLFNVWVDVWLIRRAGSNLAEWVRLAGNTLNLLAMGYLLDWPLALWLWLPVNALLADEKRVRQAVLGLVLQTAVVDLFALLAGVPWVLPVCFTVFAVICHVLAEARVMFTEVILREREEQNAQLQKAHRELEAMHLRVVTQEKLSSLGMLAAGIAHEINNPMSYVTHNVRGLMEDLPALQVSPALVEEYRTDILPATLDGLQRVNSIVADLRRFARGDPEGLVEYDLNEEIRAAARIVQGRFARARQLQLELVKLPAMLGHPRQLSQVFINLLVNAAQAVGSQGTVTVRTAETDGHVTIQVRDTGTGMDEATLKNLFQPFFTTKPVGEGMGLGLAVAHGIIRSHGGTISVESKPGEGTCFTVVLPPYPGQTPTPVPLPGPRAASE